MPASRVASLLFSADLVWGVGMLTRKVRKQCASLLANLEAGVNRELWITYLSYKYPARVTIVGHFLLSLFTSYPVSNINMTQLNWMTLARFILFFWGKPVEIWIGLGCLGRHQFRKCVALWHLLFGDLSYKVSVVFTETPLLRSVLKQCRESSCSEAAQSWRDRRILWVLVCSNRMSWLEYFPILPAIWTRITKIHLRALILNID